MGSLQKLLADDGFKKREPRPQPKLLQGFADGERKFWNRAISMPVIHHGHGTAFLPPSADPRPGEVKTRESKSLPGRKSPAVGFEKDVKDLPGFGGGNFNASRHSRRPLSLKDTGADTPLDEAATRALISILNDYIRCFFKDENFRLFLRQKCYYCVRFRENGGKVDNEDDGGAKLGDAIKVIERSVQEFPDPADLKRSYAQLSSIITGLSSSDQGGGLTSGVNPRSRLSACVHLYLSIIYKMMKKNTASAEHLLQVFCDAPFEARSILLPDLWGSLLLPHLRHLKAWYVEEAEGVSDAPCRGIQIKLLKRVYSDALDKGTYQIAAYYKGWVVRGLEAPSYPSVRVPSPSLFVASKGGSQLGIASPRSPASSSRPLISRKLYESIFDQSKEQSVDGE